MEIYRNGEVIAASQLSDLANVPERSTHDNSLVAELLVVVEDGLHALDTRVLSSSVLLLVCGLVPVEDTTDERRDQESTGLGGTDSLGQGEEEGQVAVDAVLGLEDLGSLDALPC
jgi:hypothetical protein